MTDSTLGRRNVMYRGKVQGVGFRYTATRIAQQHPVVGYVRNLSNGAVQLVVEGREADIDSFLAALANAMHENIEESLVVKETPTSDFGGFNIRP